MNDFLLEVGQNVRARKLVKTLGLPIPMPEKLLRDLGPWKALPLFEQRVIVGAPAKGALSREVASTIAGAGASALVDGPTLSLEAFGRPAEAFARPARPVDTLGDGEKVEGLVLDASALRGAADLRLLHDFFHAHLARLKRSGRAVVLARPLDLDDPEQALAQAALDGFVRSLAKELGKTGATANLVRVARGAEPHLAPVLRFVLSRRSAFITGQTFEIALPKKAAASSGSGPASRAGGGSGGSTPAGGAVSPIDAVEVRPFDKHVVLVTGAARGIGAATARLFAQEGAHVFCLDRPGDEGPLSRLARELGGTPLSVDMTAEDAPARIAEALRAKGGVDVVVHNAGVTKDKTLARMSPEHWDQTIAVNLAAIARVTAALEAGVLKDGGRVVCLASIAGIAGNVGQTNYAASKAGVIGYVRALSKKLAPRGITVNAVAPGFIETRLTAAIPFTIREVARRMSALAQGGQPEDVGQAIVFLASPGARGLTGQTLRVCGGSLVGA